ncbi:ceramide kinase isoform X1 [Vigna unguiculata]|uniref:ceramide kinase isoform X1 n=1 Tax=Vigna unguiculata TaxID=3917 RepID=UPI001016D765|nr:ceramide kinase isoform X1 [Vigna unguiculata]
MEREGNDCDVGDTSLTTSLFDGEASVLSSTFLLDHVGEVTVTFHSDRLNWKLVGSLDNDNTRRGEVQHPKFVLITDVSTCLRVKYFPKAATEIKLSEIYAVELNGHGSIYISSLPPASECLLLGQDIQMYRFTVHGFIRSKNQPSQCILADYTFGHTNLQVCRKWVNQLNASLKQEVGRPKNLLVFVHPRSGKGNGCRTWEAVAPIFSRARVETKVIVTERAGEAFDVMSSITNVELNSYDGVVAVGGDGFFNEILNGFLSPRFKAPYPPTPSDFVHGVKDNGDSLVHDGDEIVAETSSKMEDQFPLISSPKQFGSRISNLSSEDKAAEFPVPNEWFRFGIIPAGSTDAIVICTTGTRDPITSALQIVLGKRVHLDIAQVVRWKMTPRSEVEPNVRYAASFSGYGFYGDVITESEKYRWMGPTRYDYAGTMVFLKHRSYEAEIAYLDVESDEINLTSKRDYQGNLIRAIRSSHISERRICRTNCKVCNEKPNHASVGVCSLTPHLNSEETRWARSKGHFLSVGAAVISCRNEKAPDGLVADAHLSDGFLHLILIRDCPHASYLWHLTQLTRRGGSPLNFKFVEHHKTPAFTFTSSGDESVWNVDGEIFQAHQLSAQVFRGLVSMFASGPEV